MASSFQGVPCHLCLACLIQFSWPPKGSPEQKEIRLSFPWKSLLGAESIRPLGRE